MGPARPNSTNRPAAACCAFRVAQIAFKPDWNRHAKSAPFKRTDQLPQTLPFGITDNLAGKARIMGIPVWRFGFERALARNWKPKDGIVFQI